MAKHSGKQGIIFEQAFKRACSLIKLDFSVDTVSVNCMWDIEPISENWNKLLQNKKVNIKQYGTRWLFSLSANKLDKVLWGKEATEKERLVFLNIVKTVIKKRLNNIIWLSPKTEDVQKQIITNQNKKNKKALVEIFSNDNYEMVTSDNINIDFQKVKEGQPFIPNSIVLKKGGKVIARGERQAHNNRLYFKLVPSIKRDIISAMEENMKEIKEKRGFVKYKNRDGEVIYTHGDTAEVFLNDTGKVETILIKELEFEKTESDLATTTTGMDIKYTPAPIGPKVIPVKKKKKTEVYEVDICPYCNKEIGEKAYFMDEKTGYIYHRGCAEQGAIGRKNPDQKYENGYVIVNPFNVKTTGMQNYDDYMQSNKGKIEYMTPEKYMKFSAQINKKTIDDEEKEITPAKVIQFSNAMEKGEYFPVPVLDFIDGRQEGRHRVKAAAKLGINKIPVFTIKKMTRIGEATERSKKDMQNFLITVLRILKRRYPKLIFTDEAKKLSDNYEIEMSLIHATEDHQLDSLKEIYNKYLKYFLKLYGFIIRRDTRSSSKGRVYWYHNFEQPAKGWHIAIAFPYMYVPDHRWRIKIILVGE